MVFVVVVVVVAVVVLGGLILADAALTPVQFLFGSYTRFVSWFEK